MPDPIKSTTQDPTVQTKTANEAGAGAFKFANGEGFDASGNPTPASTPASAVVSSAPIQASKDAEALAANKKAIKDQATIEDLSRQKQIADLNASLGGSGATPIGAPPATPDSVKTFNDLNAKYGITDLEAKLADTTKQISDLQAKQTASKKALEGQGLGVIKPVISGEQAKIDEQANAQLSLLQNDRSFIADQINTKNNTIQTIMNLSQTNYSNAKNAYDTKFSQAVQTQSAISALKTEQMTEEDHAQTIASANLTTLQGMIKESGKTWDQLDLSTKMQLQTLELKAGLPVGSLQEFMTAVPAGKILATTTGVDEKGNPAVNFIYADAKGNPGVVRTVSTGLSSSRDADSIKSLIDKYPDANILPEDSLAQAETKVKSSAIYKAQIKSGNAAPQATDAEIKTYHKSNASAGLSQNVGKDGKVSPETYNEAKQIWISSSPFTAQEFDDAFAATYINPNNLKNGTGGFNITTSTRKNIMGLQKYD